MRNLFSITLVFAFVIIGNLQAQRSGLNTIELRNDSPEVNEYFHATYRVAPEDVEFSYYYKDGKWQKHTYEMYEQLHNTDILWGIRVEYNEPDTFNRLGFPIYKIPNVISPRKIKFLENPCQRSTKHAGISHAFMNHQKDWDFLSDTLDGILSANGLTRQSPEWDVIETLANFITDRRGGGTYVHPVDYIDSVAECTGSANLMVAFAGMLNIPARNTDFPFHASCEVFVDGKWRFVENTPYRTDQIGALQKFSVNEMVMDPVSAGLGYNDHYNEATNHRTIGRDRAYHYALDGYSNWMFNYRGTYPQNHFWRFEIVPNSTYELSILYPEQQTLFYKGLPGTKTVWLTPVKNYENSFKVSSDEAIRRYFEIHSLGKIKSVTAELLLNEKDVQNIPADGGNWYYLVNGEKYYLKDNGGWKISKDHPLTGNPYIEFNIPLKLLNAKDDHTNYPPTINENISVNPFIIKSGRQEINLTGISDGDHNKDQKVNVIVDFSNPSMISGLKTEYNHEKGQATISFKPKKMGVGTFHVNVVDNGESSGKGLNKTSTDFDILIYNEETRKIEIPVEADGYIRHDLYSGTNFGLLDSMIIRKTKFEYFNSEGILRFNINDMPYPVKAKLRLYGNASAKGSLKVYGSEQDNWKEEVLCKNEAPFGYVELDQSEILTETGYYYWDVTDFLKKQKDNTITFKIEPAHADSIEYVFKTKESDGYHPVLVIETHHFIEKNKPFITNQNRILAIEDTYIQRKKLPSQVDNQRIFVNTGFNSENGYKNTYSGIGFIKFDLTKVPDNFDSVCVSLTTLSDQWRDYKYTTVNDPVKIFIAEVPYDIKWDESMMNFNYAKYIWTEGLPREGKVLLKLLNPENTINHLYVDKSGKNYQVNITDLIIAYKKEGKKTLSLAFFEKDRDGQGNVIPKGGSANFYSKDAYGIDRNKKPSLVIYE